MSEGSWLNGNARAVGVAIGAVIAVAVGGYSGWKALEPSAHHAEAGPGSGASLTELRRDLYALAARVTALETPGGSVPMARETRERFEAFERLAVERLERMSRLEMRVEQILDRLRELEAKVSQIQDRIRDLERRRP